MKYLICLLLLSGCASMSEYRQGCLDGIVLQFEQENDNFSKFLLDKPENVEFVKKNIDKYVCKPLDDQRNQERVNSYPKNR